MQRSDISAPIPENPLQEIIDEIVLEDPAMLESLTQFSADMGKALASASFDDGKLRARGSWVSSVKLASC